MTFWRGIAITGLFLTAGATGASAQTIASLALNATVSLDGLTGQITSLTCPANGCTAGDQLEVMEISRDNIQFEIVNSNSTSSIFASTGAAEQLQFTLTISPTPGYNHKVGSATSVTQNAAGWEQYTDCQDNASSNCNNASAQVSSTFNTTVSTPTLLSTLTAQDKNTTASQQTLNGVADNIATATIHSREPPPAQ
jgi:hypothetical protein